MSEKFRTVSRKKLKFAYKYQEFDEKTSNTAEEQNMFCDGPPGEGGGGGWRPL